MDTLEIVRQMIIKEFELDPQAVQADTELKNLGVDSLAIIEFMFALEERFDVDLLGQRGGAGENVTVGDVARELDALLLLQKSPPESPPSTA